MLFIADHNNRHSTKVSIMLVGQDDGWIEVFKVNPDESLKIMEQIKLPERLDYGIKVSQLHRIDENHVLIVFYRRSLMVMNLNTLAIVSDIDLPQPISESSQWPEEIYIKDLCFLNEDSKALKLCIAVEKAGLMIVDLERKADGGFAFTHRETHELQNYQTIYWVRRGTSEGLVLFFNRDKKAYVYNLSTKTVVGKIIIQDHSGNDMGYTAPVIVPTSEYLQTGHPTLIALRDYNSLHLIDLVNNESTQLLLGKLTANNGLSQLSIEIALPPTLQGKSQKELRELSLKAYKGEIKRVQAQSMTIFTTTWYQNEQEGGYYYRQSR
jgi:hypothetical protein